MKRRIRSEIGGILYYSCQAKREIGDVQKAPMKTGRDIGEKNYSINFNSETCTWELVGERGPAE